MLRPSASASSAEASAPSAGRISRALPALAVPLDEMPGPDPATAAALVRIAR